MWPRGRVDVLLYSWTCAKNLTPAGIVLFFNICSYLVLHCSGIGLSMVVCIVSYCMLWIFPVGKIRRLRSGANPRSWVPEASMQTPRPPKPLFDPRTAQSVVSSYTDWSTRPVSLRCTKWIFVYYLHQTYFEGVRQVHPMAQVLSAYTQVQSKIRSGPNPKATGFPPNTLVIPSASTNNHISITGTTWSQQLLTSLNKTLCWQ
jgi:hypothetical protein